MAVDTADAGQGVQARPIGVTLLAGLGAVALALAVVHLFQAIGIIPYFIGQVAIRDFNIWYALMWGLMIWVWAWVIRALLDLDPSAWMFLLIVSGFNLLFDFFAVVGAPHQANDVAASFLLNLVIFGYTLLPGTKRAFGAA